MDKLDKLLHQRYEPKAPRGLADRIVQRIQKTVDSNFSFMDLFTPQYSFAMIIVLMIGLNVGFENSVLQNFTDTETTYSESDITYNFDAEDLI